MNIYRIFNAQTGTDLGEYAAHSRGEALALFLADTDDRELAPGVDAVCRQIDPHNVTPVYAVHYGPDVAIHYTRIGMAYETHDGDIRIALCASPVGAKVIEIRNARGVTEEIDPSLFAPRVTWLTVRRRGRWSWQGHTLVCDSRQAADLLSRYAMAALADVARTAGEERGRP